MSNNWGTSDSGHSYTSTSTTDYAVTGTTGTISSAKGITRSAYPNSVNQQDTETTIKFKVDSLPNGANYSLSIVSRNIGSNNYYRSKLFIGTDRLMYVNFSYLLNGSETDISSNTGVPGISVSADTYYWVKTQVSGTSPTTLKIKVWPDGDTEPTEWHKTVTNSQANLQTTGITGLQTYVGSGSTITPVLYTFDDYTITDVPAPTPTPTPYSSVSDDFNRSFINGWGETAVGGTYTVASGSLTDYAVSGGKATMRTSSGNSSHRAYLHSVSLLDSDQMISFSTDKLAEGSTMYESVLARTDGTLNNEYFLQVLLRTSNRVAIRICKLVSGSETCLTSEYTVPELVHEPNDEIRIRFQVSGTNPTTLKGKAWKVGWKEPLDWQVTATDSEAVLQSANAVGTRNYISASATNLPIVYSFDDYSVTNTITSGTVADVAGSSQLKGVSWHVGSWYNTSNAPGAYYWPGVYSDLKHLKAAGISQVRYVMNIGTQSTCKATGFYTAMAEAVDTFGVESLITIQIPNALTTTATTEQRQQFRDWLTTMVTCYKDDFKYWEIGNEPNLSQFWNIDDDPSSDQTAYEASVQAYYDFLEDAYSVIKSIDPSATVIHAGLSQHKLDRWLAAAADIDPRNSFDAMGFHPYSDYGPEGNVNQLNIMYKWLQNTPGMSSKPIWVTEVGYTDNPTTYPGNTGGDADLKAEYLTGSMQDLRTWGLDTPIFWYDFAQIAANPEEGYPLITSNRTAATTTFEPAYTAMQALWSGNTNVDTTSTATNIAVITSDSAASITWRTNTITSGQIKYGLSSSLGQERSSVNLAPMFKSHSDTLSDLKACTKYIYTISSTDVYGVTKTTPYLDFTTTGCAAESTESSCQKVAPETPKVVSVERQGSSATVYLSPSKSEKDQYLISFGTNNSADQYNLVFSESETASLVTAQINELDATATYYFKAQARNGCTYSGWSSTLASVPHANINTGRSTTSNRSTADSRTAVTSRLPITSESESETLTIESPEENQQSDNDKQVEQPPQGVFGRITHFFTSIWNTMNSWW